MNSEVKKPLDEYLMSKEYKKKEKKVDRWSNNAYSFGVGLFLDFAKSHLGWIGAAASRTEAFAFNYFLAPYYGKWVDKVYKTAKVKQPDNKLKDVLKDAVHLRLEPLGKYLKTGTRYYLADLFAFNTFQTPQYGATVFISSLVEQIVKETVKYGIGHLASDYSPDFHAAFNNALAGMKGLAELSPYIGFTMNLTMSSSRYFLKLLTPAYKSTAKTNNNKTNNNTSASA